MSSFSYISFPREVDKSCMESKFDQSKAFIVGEIKGTDLAGKFSGIDDLPENLSVYLGDWSDFHGINVFDCGDAVFTDVFANQHVYGFQATFKLLDAEEFLIISKKAYDEFAAPDESEEEHMAYSHGLIKENRDNVTLCRQQLYDIIRHNIKPGEVAEIYTNWVDYSNIYDFGPPDVKITLDLEEVLTSESLDLVENSVIVICRNK